MESKSAYSAMGSETNTVIGMKASGIKEASQQHQDAKQRKSQKKVRLRSQIRRVQKKAKKIATKVIWGNHMDNFNTVRDTYFVSFFWMQVIRLICFLALMGILGVYTYVYVRSALFYFNYLALFITCLAFFFLLVGAGK